MRVAVVSAYDEEEKLQKYGIEIGLPFTTDRTGAFSQQVAPDGRVPYFAVIDGKRKIKKAGSVHTLKSARDPGPNERDHLMTCAQIVHLGLLSYAQQNKYNCPAITCNSGGNCEVKS